MSKFRAAVIAATLTIMFFIPMSAMPKVNAYPLENEEPFAEASEESDSAEENPPEEGAKEGTFRIYDLENETVLEVGFSDYVKGAVASEMGADFEYDALVAQGIAAFSCGLYQKEAHAAADYDFSAAPEKKLGYMTEEKAKEVYGEAFEEKWAVIESAAKEAMKYVLTYENKPALAVYHAVSAGRTESSENAWGGAVPYLVSVESPGDTLSGDYETAVTVSRNSALEILNKSGAGLSGEMPEEWFAGAVMTDAGYVDYIQIGAATFSGERLRSLFGLRSAAFEVSYIAGDFVFTVWGYGHGVGLSQVGANYMAKNGADFREILAHYYPGTVLLEYEDIY